MDANTRRISLTNLTFWRKKTPPCVLSWYAATSLSTEACSPVMVSSKVFQLRKHHAAARAATRRLETATAIADDQDTTLVVAQLPRSTRGYCNSAVNGHLTQLMVRGWAQNSSHGICRGWMRDGHTQDDLQAVEMLHSNPKGYTQTNLLWQPLSHETRGRIPTYFFLLLDFVASHFGYLFSAHCSF